MTRTLLCAAALGSLALTASPAIAKDESAPSVTVQYDDLDLSTTRDQRRLEERIDIAARRICDIGVPATGTRAKTVEQRRCYAAAKKSVEKQLATVLADYRFGG